MLFTVQNELSHLETLIDIHKINKMLT